jgi:hypothetical protein
MTNVYRSSGKALVRHILMKLEFSRQIFEKSSYIKFHETLSSCVTVTTHVCLVPKFKLHRAIPPLLMARILIMHKDNCTFY